MNKLELEFRKRLCDKMAGRWLVAIHVENHLNPGVPDLSYVMLDQFKPIYETGWLELKAAEHRAVPKFEVEPSQHNWMRRYAHRVPTHFLVLVGTRCYLLDGKVHSLLVGSVTLEQLQEWAIVAFEEQELIQTLPIILKGLTQRGDDGTERVI